MVVHTTGNPSAVPEMCLELRSRCTVEHPCSRGVPCRNVSCWMKPGSHKHLTCRMMVSLTLKHQDAWRLLRRSMRWGAFFPACNGAPTQVQWCSNASARRRKLELSTPRIFPLIQGCDRLKEDLIRGIYAYGFERPSAIQQRAILPILKGRDVIAQ